MPKKDPSSQERVARGEAASTSTSTSRSTSGDAALVSLTASLQQLRTDVVEVVSKLARDRSSAEHRDLQAVAERLQSEMNALFAARGQDLTTRIGIVDALVRDLTERLTEGARRVEDIDRRVSRSTVEALVETAAKESAESVYSRYFQPGLDALTEAFGDADDRLQRLRAYVDQFGPGGLPVVAQERDALRVRVAEQREALEAAGMEIHTLQKAVADRDAADLRRRVIDGVDPEALERRLFDVAARERDLEARAALNTENRRLETEIERLRAELTKWEEIGRAEQTERVNTAELQRVRDELSRADQARATAERGRSHAMDRMRTSNDELEAANARLRAVEQERASGQERTRRLEEVTEENRAFARQFEEQKRMQSELERRVRDAEVERAQFVAEIIGLERQVENAKDAGRREEAQSRAEALRGSRAELDSWAEAEAERRAQLHVARAEALGKDNEGLKQQGVTARAEIARLEELHRRSETARLAAEIELSGVRDAHDKRLALLEQEVLDNETRVLAAAHDEAERIRTAAEGDAERTGAESDARAARVTRAAETDAVRRRALADEAERARNGLRDELVAMSAQKGELTAHLDRLKAEVWELKQRVIPAEERIRSLEEPIFGAEDLRPATPHSDEGQWLQHLEAGIEKAGFVFHPRLVRAFHTSLKIAHHAPLVVLGGISGTGKSELPRLYADLGGLPFLPLAVQPSWDSPHDLFGFFNYTDGRLKAEPLARLYRQVGKSEDPLRKSPTIVMLDEMNLARVEYYFADLLSKLEARRSIRGSADAARRKRASVAVDTGPDGGEIPLFLDERILFVGTMNQDESTLTLSDKVLDRACVLTFPAPREMHLTQQSEVTHRPDRLAWDTWMGWTRAATAGENEARLNEINRFMADLGRPFGHRLFRAIHAYVENYPGSKEHAFSDQFAMKVLPRLRGLECQGRSVRDALDALGGLVPDELRSAFGTARDHEFFSWGGAPDLYQVDRA